MLWLTRVLVSSDMMSRLRHVAIGGDTDADCVLGVGTECAGWLFGLSWSPKTQLWVFFIVLLPLPPLLPMPT